MHFVLHYNMSISVQALVDLCCVTVTKVVGTTDDFRLPTDVRQTLQRYVFYSGCVCSPEIIRYMCDKFVRDTGACTVDELPDDVEMVTARKVMITIISRGFLLQT